MTMMIIITFCALDSFKLEFLTCKCQLVWNMLIKFSYIIIIIINNNNNNNRKQFIPFGFISGLQLQQIEVRYSSQSLIPGECENAK